MFLIWCSWTVPWTVLNLFMGFTRTFPEILNETRILTFQELTRIVQGHLCSWLIQELKFFIGSFKSVLKKSYVLEHLQFRCCSWNVKNSSHLIFQELPLNSSRTVEAQFKNVQEQLHQNNSWKVLNNSRTVLKVFAGVKWPSFVRFYMSGLVVFWR